MYKASYNARENLASKSITLSIKFPMRSMTLYEMKPKRYDILKPRLKYEIMEYVGVTHPRLTF